MHVFFTTVVRAAPQAKGGELVKMDWDTKTILQRAAITPSHPPVNDPNPRGSTRGGRGVLLNGDQLFAASYHTLEIFDRALTPVGRVSNRLFAGLHELAWDEDRIWASATCLDCAVCVDKSGALIEYWSPREDPLLTERFGLPKLTIDVDEDNRTKHVGVSTMAPGHVHLNAIAMQAQRPLMLLNRYGCLARLNPTEILVDDPSLKGCHNVLVTASGTILINDTVNRALRVYEADGRPRKIVNLLRFGEIDRIRKRYWLRDIGCWLRAKGRPHRIFGPLLSSVATARPLFVRGLCETPRGTFLLGLSPATIVEIDLEREQLVALFSYSNSVNVCIHGLACSAA